MHVNFLRAPKLIPYYPLLYNLGSNPANHHPSPLSAKLINHKGGEGNPETVKKSNFGHIQSYPSLFDQPYRY